MGGEANRHPVVDVRPLRMMVHLLGHNGGRGHKTESGDEAVEGEGSVDTTVLDSPPGRLGKAVLLFFDGELVCGHGSTLAEPRLTL